MTLEVETDWPVALMTVVPSFLVVEVAVGFAVVVVVVVAAAVVDLAEGMADAWVVGRGCSARTSCLWRCLFHRHNTTF